jgi:bifunctional non-homologous end joining protein LigD
VSLPIFHPLLLILRPEPFSHPEWIFEVKYDGFRALAYVEGNPSRLVSRKDSEFGSFVSLNDEIAKTLGSTRASLMAK